MSAPPKRSMKRTVAPAELQADVRRNDPPGPDVPAPDYVPSPDGSPETALRRTVGHSPPVFKIAATAPGNSADADWRTRIGLICGRLGSGGSKVSPGRANGQPWWVARIGWVPVRRGCVPSPMWCGAWRKRPFNRTFPSVTTRRWRRSIRERQPSSCIAR